MKHLSLSAYDMSSCFIDVAQTLLRACLRGGGGPQVGEVTRLGGVTHLSI